MFSISNARSPFFFSQAFRVQAAMEFVLSMAVKTPEFIPPTRDILYEVVPGMQMMLEAGWPFGERTIYRVLICINKLISFLCTIQYNTIQYNIMQCNAMQCKAMQCNAIQYNTIQCNAMQYNAVQCNTIQCYAIQCNVMQYNTIQYNAIQSNAMQYNTIQNNTIQYNTIK